MVRRTHGTPKQILKAHLALTLLLEQLEGLLVLILQKLRTEIVLKDAADVAFWFSLSLRFATFRQQPCGERPLPFTHQTRARQKPLFPLRVSTVKKISSGEDEAK